MPWFWGKSDHPAPLGPGPGAVGCVVVDPEHVDGRADHRRVAGLHEAPVRQVPGRLDHVLGIGPPQDRVEVQAVEEAVHQVGRRDVLGAVRGGQDRPEVQGDGQLLLRARRGAQRLKGKAVAEEEVVHGRHGTGRLGPARGMDPGPVPEVGRAPRLVQGGPEVDTVPERVVDQAGVVGEPMGGVARRPAAGVLERLRQVPVVQGHSRGDPPREQGVHEPVVEGEPRGVDGPAAVGLDPGPGDREPVGAQVQRGHEVHVLGVPVVVVGRHVPGVPAQDPAGGVAEGVPDRGAATVLSRGALDLVGRRGGPPDEPLWEPSSWAHPLTAPAMMPETRCLPATKNRTMRGMVASVTPAMISARSLK